jgi:NAD(P)-dependent dehydrogenase (short-subunit alcohol dehydrogenase family)
VNNAGVLLIAPIASTVEQYRRVIDVNQIGCLLACSGGAEYDDLRAADRQHRVDLLAAGTAASSPTSRRSRSAA